MRQIFRYVLTAAAAAAWVARILVSVLLIGPAFVAGTVGGGAIALESLSHGSNPVHEIALGIADWGAEFRSVPPGTVPVMHCPRQTWSKGAAVLPPPIPISECSISAQPLNAWLVDVTNTIGLYYSILVILSAGFALAFRPRPCAALW